MLRIVGLILDYLFPRPVTYLTSGPGPQDPHWFQKEKGDWFKINSGRLVLPSVLRRRSAPPHSPLNTVEPSLPEEEEEDDVDPESLL